MVHPDAQPGQRALDSKQQPRATAGGAGGQSARVTRTLLQRSAMAGELGLAQYAAGPGLAAGHLARSFFDGHGRPSAEFLNHGSCTNGFCPAMKRPADSERGMAMLATLMAVALMTVIVMDFAYSATAGFRA